jgi:Zn-dependent M28 family amino/carboxypeptidase
LLTQCAFGPRVPGSAAHAQCADWIVERFEEAGWHVQRDPFTARVALLRQEIGMQNILATRSPDAQPELILTAHWDTRPIADQDPDPANRDRPILGASDGASGVAVLLEVARCLTEADAERVGFVLYDGEDLGTAPRPDQWCLGSKHFAAVTLPALGWPVARGINIDLVGDRDLQLKRELNSDTLAPEWTDLVWRLGQRRHPDVYVDQTREVYDDHMPLLSRGIPHIDIIDIEFSAWHTLQDTPEACSADSLAIVGEVLLDVVRTLGAEGARPGRESGSGKRNEPDAGP